MCPGAAGATQDFVPLSQSIVFAAHSRQRARQSHVNELQQTVRVQVLGDHRAEGDETFNVWLENLETTDSRVVLIGGREKVNAVGVISDDDAAPVLAPIADGTAQVGEVVSIVAAATDADGDPITYSWSRGSQTPALPAGTVLNQVRLSFSPSTAGVYTLNVTASDSHGNDATEDVVIRVSAPLSTPSAPTGFSAQAGDGQVTLSWTGANDESITGYELRQKGKEGRGWGPWTPITYAGAETTSHTVSGLVNGKSYSYKIRAVNAAGAGAASQTVKVTPVAPLATPAAITLLEAIGRDGVVVLLWEVTDESITGYELRQQRQSEGVWGEWAPISSPLGSWSYRADYYWAPLKMTFPPKHPRGERKVLLLRLTVKPCHRKAASCAITPTLVIFCNSIINQPAALLYLFSVAQYHRCR